MDSTVMICRSIMNGTLQIFTIKKSQAEVPIKAYLGKPITRRYSWATGPAALASIVATPPMDPNITPKESDPSEVSLLPSDIFFVFFLPSPKFEKEMKTGHTKQNSSDEHL